MERANTHNTHSAAGRRRIVNACTIPREHQRLETRSFRCVSRAFLRRRTGNWLVVRATSRVSGAPEFVYRGLTLPRKATRRFSFRPCPFPLRASSSFEISYAFSTLRGISLTCLSAMFYGPGSRKRKKKRTSSSLFLS